MKSLTFKPRVELLPLAMSASHLSTSESTLTSNPILPSPHPDSSWKAVATQLIWSQSSLCETWLEFRAHASARPVLTVGRQVSGEQANGWKMSPFLSGKRNKKRRRRKTPLNVKSASTVYSDGTVLLGRQAEAGFKL